MQDRSIKSVEELASIAREFDREGWIFRGVQNSATELIPRIGRAEARKDPHASHPRPSVEYSVEQEILMLRNFRKRVRPLLSHQPESEIEWMALGQHHGMPTRLLDWTESPLIAAYFACKERDVDEGPPPAIVGISDLPFLSGSPWSISDACLYRPPRVSPNIAAQRGVLTVHPRPQEPFIRTGMIRWKIEPPELFFDIKLWLDRCGINQASMFPGIDGEASYAGWQYKWGRLPGGA